MNLSLYPPLDQSAQEFRVLTIESTTSDQQSIRCTLSTQSLSCLESNFVAFSYVWGTEEGRETIYVNEVPIQITRNLYELLHVVKSPAVAPLQLRYLWIDAVCINQADKAERASQVQLMRRIYREARFVVAWLGEPSDDSKLAFKVLNIAADQRAAGTKFHSTSWLEGHKDLLCTFEETSTNETDGPLDEHLNTSSDADPPYNSAWRSIFNLAKRPYFKRLWTFQEMVLPCTLYLLCGPNISLLDDLLWLFNWIARCDLYSCPSFMDEDVWAILADTSYVRTWLEFNSLARIYRARKNCHGNRNLENLAACKCQKASLPLIGIVGKDDFDNHNRPNLTLWEIARITISLQATDPRDKVYGILGLSESTIIPDYTKSIREVLTQFACTGLRDDFHRVLTLSRWVDRQMQPENIDPELPSWVPPLNLRGGRFTIIRSLTYMHASQLQYMNGRIWPRDWMTPWTEDDILHVQGLLCDQVSNVSDLIACGSVFDLVSHFIEEQNPDVPYVTRIPRFQAVLRVLLQDEDLESRGPLKPGDGTLQRHAWAFLSWLLLEQDGIDLELFLDKLGLRGLLDDKDRDIVFQARVLGDAEDGEYVAERFSIHEALNPAQGLWTPIETSMKNNEKHRLFQTEDGYLGIGPRTMRSGDSISVLFGCHHPVVLRSIGPHHLQLGPCFVLGFMEGETIRDLANGSRVVREFQIC